MNPRYPPVLALFLCIALVITLLPLIGAAEPASATRGYLHGTITASDYAPTSPPIRGITVFIARPDGSSPFTLRTNESGMYRTGILDDRGVGFTVSVNSPDKSAYNPRYESASAENVLFTVNDPDGEIRDFALHGSATSTATPTATPTPSPTTVIPTATPTATPTPDALTVEADMGVEQAPATSGYIHGTVRASDGTPLANIPVVVWRKDGGLLKVPTTNSGGYFNTGTIQDPDKKGFQVNANKFDQGNRNPRYEWKEQGPYYLTTDPDGTVADFYLKPVSGSGSTKVTLSGQVVADAGSGKLEGITVFFWRQDEVPPLYATTDKEGKFSVQVEKYSGNCGKGSKCYNIIANKPGVAGYTDTWFNSSEQVNIQPYGDRTLSTFRLLTGTVTFKGKVYAGGKPLQGITVLLWRHDDQSWQAVTNEKGEWQKQVPRSVWMGGAPGTTDHRINLAINKPGIGTYNPYYNTPPDTNNIPSLNDYTASTTYLDTRLVTFSGRVTDASHSTGIPGITVFFYRQDKKEQLFATTNVSGYYLKQVERSSDITRKYNLAANKPDLGKDHPMNTSYAYDAKKDINNIQPSGDRTGLNFRLDPTFVIYSGTVWDKKTSKGVPGVWVYFWRKDGNGPADPYARTGSDGTFSMVLGKSCVSGDGGKYNVAANKNNPGHPQDTRYAYDPSSSSYNRNDVSACYDSRGMNFYLESYSVTFSGTVIDSRTKAGIPGISVNFQGNNGKSPWTTTGDGGVYSILVDRSYDTKVKYIPRANNDSAGQTINPGYTVVTLSSRQPYTDQKDINFYLSPVTPPVTPTPTPTPNPNPTPPVTPTPTPSPDHTRFTVVAAEMVSPEDLGVAVKATYPSWIGRDTPREVTIEATINGKYVKKTIPVTQYTTPGSEWDASTTSGTFRVKPTTPIRINLREAGVPRFTDDVSFSVSGKASYQGGVPSRASSVTATVPLPVIFYHGYMEKIFRIARDIWDGSIQRAAYEPFSSYLLQKGYNREEEWGVAEKAQLALRGYPIRRYVTLLDTGQGVTYTTAEEATPGILLSDVQATVDRIRSSSYADRVNMVGHSTGGLVSFYYASVRPGNVARVITVGTPMEGVSEIYNKAFDKDIGSREEAEQLLVAHDGPGRGQENTIRWFMPKYVALEIPGYVAGRDPNPYFTSTFTFTSSTSVDYHHIYSSSHADTLKTLVLEKNTDGRWYHVKEVKYGAGDGTVLATSGSNPRMSGTNIHRWPVSITERHAFMLKEASVHNAIWNALKHKRFVPTSETVVEGLVVSSPSIISTGDLITPTPTQIPSLIPVIGQDLSSP